MQAVEKVVRAVVPFGEVLIEIKNLVVELRGSKRMVEELVDHLEKVAPRLQKLLDSSVAREIAALQEYEELVTGLREALQRHLQRKRFARAWAHYSLVDAVEKLKGKLELVKERLYLDHELNMLSFQQRIDEAREQAADEIAELKALIEAQPHKFAEQLQRDKVTVDDLMDLKNDLAASPEVYSDEEKDVYRSALERALTALGMSKLPSAKKWYISANTIVYDDGNPFATSDDQLRALYQGTILLGSKVTVKTVRASSDRKDIQAFDDQVKLWYELRHPNILPLYSANNSGHQSGRPLLLVMGRAENGNFRDYLATRPYRIWSLFLDAARGLAYLHKQNKKPIVHGNLKCNNLLVTADGVGVVADFAFAFVRTHSAMSVKPQAPSYHWKAPERFDPTSRINEAWDVYALGMCLVEALTGKEPYADVDEDTAIDMIKRGQLPTLPASVNVPKEGSKLIDDMCKRQLTLRLSLNDAIHRLEWLADWEAKLNRTAQCVCISPSCTTCRLSVARKKPTYVKYTSSAY